MNREIKFRAWDNENGYMVTSETSIGNIVKKQIVGGYNLMQNGNLGSADMKLGRYELMQYIGQNDKNKKEIYQQDFVKVGNKVYLVTWHDRYCSFAIKSKGDLHNHFFGEAFEAEDCEVIGNIYENPELLKDNK